MSSGFAALAVVMAPPRGVSPASGLEPGFGAYQLSLAQCQQTPLVLFLHGFPEYSGAWDEVLPAFAKSVVDTVGGEATSALALALDASPRTVQLPAGRYETLLPPSAVADLMIYLMWTMEGRGAQEGHTALSRAGGQGVIRGPFPSEWNHWVCR